MLITPSLLQKFNGIIQDTSDKDEAELINIYIGTAQRVISDYVGFDSETVIAEDSKYSKDTQQLFRLTCLRIATLLQSECGANIGINSTAEPGVSRSFLNVVDYTPYLKQLSAFRKNTGA